MKFLPAQTMIPRSRSCQPRRPASIYSGIVSGGRRGGGGGGGGGGVGVGGGGGGGGGGVVCLVGGVGG